MHTQNILRLHTPKRTQMHTKHTHTEQPRTYNTSNTHTHTHTNPHNTRNMHQTHTQKKFTPTSHIKHTHTTHSNQAHRHLTHPKHAQTTRPSYHPSLINGDNLVKIREMGQLNADVIGSGVEVYLNRLFYVEVNSLYTDFEVNGL